ncbi:uncharacterized protein K441DRAFT_354897 [Cenococcum geophilum 1.58]|uniref:Uncharacterized protein n=1 Tax=Cenococcum geophilum 1.58 TaxID=794803 RepID=A0ACC8EPL4_9PEZI|nr:hypothetical protein K441DRAFT_354897 [Cenococcum geophilum 1.58]
MLCGRICWMRAWESLSWTQLYHHRTTIMPAFCQPRKPRQLSTGPLIGQLLSKSTSTLIFGFSVAFFRVLHVFQDKMVPF